MVNGHEPRLRAFRALLRLYPKSYRDRYGDEMAAFFLRERAASGGGPRFWAGVVLDHIEAAWAVRGRAGKEEGMMTTWWDDLRASSRALVRAPRFTAFAVTTLALGVAAVTSVFTVLERVALRPLPYPGSERMVLVGIDPRHDPGSIGPLSPALFDALSASPGPVEALAVARARDAVLRADADPERVRISEVSDGLLPMLAAGSTEGRLLLPSDFEPDAPEVVLLGHRAWVERFGADPGVVGRTVRLDDRLHTVVGVLDVGVLPPPEVVEADEFWVPLRLDPSVTETFYLAGLGRLRPGAGIDEADRHADDLFTNVYADTRRPDFLLGASVRDYRASVVGPIGSDLGRVMAGVTLLLLIACVNVAGLLLTRGAERRHELGVHFALGAPRRRLVRRLFAESAVIAGAGAAIGAAMAWGAVELFRAYAPRGLPRLAEVSLDGTGLLFAIVVAGGSTVLFGLVPALRSTKRVADGVHAARGSTLGRGEVRLRGALVVVETGLAVVMAVASTLLAHDLVRVVREDPGFRPDGLVAMTLNLAPRFDRDEWIPTWDRILDEARSIPGAAAVAVATQAPWDGSRVAATYRPEGWEEEESVFATTVGARGDYLEALGARLVAGRALDEADEGGEPVAMVNRSFVNRYWPGESGLGRRVAGGEEDEPVHRIVGVVDDVRTRPGRDVFPTIYLPFSEAVWREMDVLVRTTGETGAIATGLRDVVRRVDGELPVTSIRTMDALASSALAAPRFYAALFGSFALIALLLAVVGVYGTTAYATRARLREAGIRLALGARSDQVVARLVAHSGRAVAVGVGLGLAGAALASRVLAGRLVYVDPRDLATYATVGAIVVLTGIVAAWLPAGAAGRADPIRTLREE